MSANLFRTGGALTDEYIGVYIERQADYDALMHLQSMDYLLIIEPRQQGKTSLIHHLRSHPGLDDVASVYLDVTTTDRSSETSWYKTLCPRVLRQLQDFIPHNQRPPVPQNSANWREFLCEVAIFAADAHKSIVIALDEIGAVTFPGATEFFSVLRDVYNSRQAETDLKQITFLLAGAFDPRDLIQDDKISPFNVAQRVRLDDFTAKQVLELVTKGNWPEDQAVALAKRIHYWTDGQPYLTQLLCSYLGPDATPADVDTGVDRLRREDENHLPPLIDRLEREEKLCQYVDRILFGERIKFYPREHRRQAKLELLGFIKEGSEGYCAIRNRIYKQVLMEKLEPKVEPVTKPFSHQPSSIRRLYSLRINANFEEVWRCLVYTRDQEDSYWTTQKRLWWSVDEKKHSKNTKSATLLLGINHPDADSIYNFNERRLNLFQGAEGWTMIEVHADPAAELQSDPEATKIFDDFLDNFEQMFKRLGYKVIKMNKVNIDEDGQMTVLLPTATGEMQETSIPRSERVTIPFKLQLSQRSGHGVEIRALKTPAGEPLETSRLPYTYADLVAILKALPATSLDAADLKPDQRKSLHALNLLTESGLVPDLQQRVGEVLYQTLFTGDIYSAFQTAWYQARRQRGAVRLQLRFYEDAVALARYPWELIHDNRRHLLPSGAVELTRYISYPEATTTLSVEPPLHVLYIESRPNNLTSLPKGKEQTTVRAALEALAEDGRLVLKTLSSPTYNALIDRVERNQDHVLHFDGHGTVARRCPTCGAMNYPYYTICQQSGCNRSLANVPPLGYLAFEKERSHEVDWVDSEALKPLLYPSQVRVAVLSACRSGEVRGETLFGGVGPALIQAGVPAVVAMQVPITVFAAAKFMRGFYGALARFASLPAAMTSGRRRLFRGREWFIPVLYLRSDDDEGRLFVKQP